MGSGWESVESWKSIGGDRLRDLLRPAEHEEPCDARHAGGDQLDEPGGDALLGLFMAFRMDLKAFLGAKWAPNGEENSSLLTKHAMITCAPWRSALL